MVVCPRCDGNGVVHKAIIREFNIIVQICDECEAMWLEHEPLILENFKDFSTYMEEQGFNGVWSKIDIVDL